MAASHALGCDSLRMFVAGKRGLLVRKSLRDGIRIQCRHSGGDGEPPALWRESGRLRCKGATVKRVDVDCTRY